MTGLDPARPSLRIGNCSGFYGDRLSAMREMLEDGPLDVLTGDYLAELTMLILGRDQLKDPSLGYARTFVRQVEDCLGLALERGVKLVSNAGGLNPAGLAARLQEIAAAQGLSPAIAYVHGDDVRSLGMTGALTANAYLGGFGIAEALSSGADIVVTGRVTDASLVVGPAVAHFGWDPTAYDELAGAVVAGHVLECGTQATGGNFSGFLAIPDPGRPLGFPLAVVHEDGSSVVTKHGGTGGMVTLDTVTAQLMYEVQSTRYLGPDVTAHLDTVRLGDDGPDRVRISGVCGSAPPEQLKVCVNELGGHRNSVDFVLTGLDVEAKAAWVRAQLEPRLTASSVTWTLGPLPRPDADTEEGASTLLRCTVQDASAEAVGRGFSSAAVELALASYPGFTMTAPPGPGSPYAVYRAEYVDRSSVTHTVTHADGHEVVVDDPPGIGDDNVDELRLPVYAARGEVLRRPLGSFVHARSGDKGGDANLGLWVARDGHPSYDDRVAWLLGLVTRAFVHDLLPETAPLPIEVFALPELGGVNVVIHELLGRGVAASTRFDPQAKGLGEWARSRLVDVPEELL
ncbi:acyclic terpene utilization AtuA family protein [Nocardioides cynanchi]|uniref:acyclic terpene utilization AtuA family protein n=1 Tax=Nocardioides cynanchi TaxID=2558918 RepID=UPI001245C8BB|nr:acyclic terpene utilization AtuA family protein [Nocardioides cynanchi]